MTRLAFVTLVVINGAMSLSFFYGLVRQLLTMATG